MTTCAKEMTADTKEMNNDANANTSDTKEMTVAQMQTHLTQKN